MNNISSFFYLCPWCGGPLSRTIYDVAKLLRDRWRLRTEAVAHLEDVVAAVTNFLNAGHVANLLQNDEVSYCVVLKNIFQILTVKQSSFQNLNNTLNIFEIWSFFLN